MTEEDRTKYEEHGREMEKRIEARAAKISTIQNKLKNTKSIDELEKLSNKLDKLLKEVRIDQELNADIMDMLAVEHFLEHGNGVNFDPEY